jgi:hypothetical protein
MSTHTRIRPFNTRDSTGIGGAGALARPEWPVEIDATAVPGS